MAEVIGTVAAVGSILKALTSTGALIHAISRAPREARLLADQIDATKATLKSLRASLRTMNRSQAFMDLWTDPTRQLLANLKETIDQLNLQLGGKRVSRASPSMSFWSRVRWPFDREETLMLQMQMQSYLQLLGMIQNAFLQ